jgi:multiple sugar transport system permease protein
MIWRNALAFKTSQKPVGLSKKPHIKWTDLRENLTGCLFILPAFIIIGLFGLFPIGFSAYVSLHQWRINPGNFLGLDNYNRALGNLAYVAFFWLAAILLFLAIRAYRNLTKSARDKGETPFLWTLPGLVTALGIAAFVRFIVLLLPEILGIANKVRGMVRTQELFVQLLGEAWRTPAVQAALRFSFLILAVGFILAYLVNRFLARGPHSSANYPTWILIFIYLGSGTILGWFNWTEIQKVYALALETGEPIEIWAEVITISTGFLLLFASWRIWKSAAHRDSNVSVILRIAAAAVLAVGAWTLIAELPRAVQAGDADWWQGLRVTVFYSIGTVPFQLAISLILATLLFQEIRGKSLYRLIYFLPYITPAVATAAIFRVFFSSRPNAPINSLLSAVGAESLMWLDEPKGVFQILLGNDVELGAWLAGPSLALLVIIIFNIWSYVGYDTVIFLAGLGGIPGELYEAASIDGANRWDQFRHVTLPLLSPTTYFLTLLAVIGTFKAFNHVWVLRSAAALGTTDTASIIIFTEFNRNTRYGYAASLAFVLLGVILILTIINNKIAEERVFYG